MAFLKLLKISDVGAEISMAFLKLLKIFKSDESGALSLNWAAMSAAVLGFGQVVMTVVGSGVTGLGDAIVVEQRRQRHN